MSRVRFVFGSLLFVGLGGLTAARPAFAQDDPDEFEFEDETPATPAKPAEPPKKDPKAPAPPAEPPKKAPVTPEESDDIEFEDETPAPPPTTKPGTKPTTTPPAEDKPFLDDEDEREDAELLAEGTDNEQIFSAAEDETKGMASDEEVMFWETYLQKYPNSVFRKRIEDRIEKLVDDQFKMRIDSGSSGTKNADDMEMSFVSPMHMTNVNPRTRAYLAFAFGFPTYTELTADFEYAFKRNISAHAGLNGRYTGWSFDAGARWAFVKSTRLQFVATLVADIGLNFNQRVNVRQEGVDADPNRIFFQARPQLAFGKIIGPAQVLLTIGGDIGSRANTNPAIIGGAHVGVRIAPPVGLYAETDYYIRNIGREGGPFHFTVLSFGFKFYPMAKKTDDPLEIGMAGTLPIAQSYFQPYLGEVQVQGAYYPTFGSR
jgi:hypothetical protein